MYNSLCRVVKTDFHVLKLKFHACSFKQAFYPPRKLNCVTLTTQTYFYKLFVRYLDVKPARVNAALVRKEHGNTVID